jgi:hypothetical protein
LFGVGVSGSFGVTAQHSRGFPGSFGADCSGSFANVSAGTADISPLVTPPL